MADFSGGYSSAVAALGTDQDLQEEEVWAVVKAAEGCSNSKSKSKSKSRKLSGSSSSSSPARRSSAIPRSAASAQEGSTRQSSAPVRIPDWPKILKKKKKKPNKNPWDDACDVDDDNGINSNHDDDGEDDDYSNDGMVPPHEYLARRLARSQIASFSMCEGVGRTLKGRDLSNLRNAILTKTGFLE